MKNLEKVFKRGEYFQSYELLLEAHYEPSNNRWIYDTHYRQNEKDNWKPYDADEEKVLPVINEFINSQIEKVANSSIVKFVK